jgi:hypothetical protein
MFIKILGGRRGQWLSLEMAPQDGPAGRDSHVGPRSHSGARRDQYGVTAQVRFFTVLGKDLTSPYLYGTAWSKFLEYAVRLQACL